MYSVIVQHVAQSSAQAPSTSSVWEMGGVIAAAGAAGGIVNALLNSGDGYGFQWPHEDRNNVLQLGSWGIYCSARSRR